MIKLARTADEQLMFTRLINILFKLNEKFPQVAKKKETKRRLKNIANIAIHEARLQISGVSYNHRPIRSASERAAYHRNWRRENAYKVAEYKKKYRAKTKEATAKNEP